jgi:RNA polymerase sigma-70 factor, ECF subfamily
MAQPEYSEEELLQRAGRGEMRAFERLYDLLAPRLFGLLRQMLPDEREAEDMLQDGFVMLWERASSYDPSRSRAFPWAVIIFRQKAIDRMRTMGRRNRMVDRAALDTTALSAAGIEQIHERSAEVQSAFDVLPKEQRQLIECAFLKGLTHHVLADVMSLPLGTVKSSIRSGLLRLHGLLKGGV